MMSSQKLNIQKLTTIPNTPLYVNTDEISYLRSVILAGKLFFVSLPNISDFKFRCLHG